MKQNAKAQNLKKENKILNIDTFSVISKKPKKYLIEVVSSAIKF